MQRLIFSSSPYFRCFPNKAFSFGSDFFCPRTVFSPHKQALRQQSEVLAKAEGQLAEGVRVNRENIEEMQASTPGLQYEPCKTNDLK